MNRPESGRGMEDYANWHPETTVEIVPAENEISGLEKEFSNIDQTIEAQAAGAIKYSEQMETEGSPETKHRNAAREFYTKFAPIYQARIKEISELFASGRNEEALAMGKALIEESKHNSAQFLTDRVETSFAEYSQREQEASTAFDQSEKGRLYKLAMEAVDFVPVVGSAKMLGEGLAGKTMSGEKLTKSKRLWHTAQGAAFLALDLTGVGAAAAEGMKAGRVVTRSAALMRKTGMAREVYSSVYKTGKFLIDNPIAAKVADKAFEKAIAARKMSAASLVEKTKQALWTESEEEEKKLAVAA